VAESAAIGKPDPMNMEVVKAVRGAAARVRGQRDLELDLMNFVRKKLRRCHAAGDRVRGQGAENAQRKSSEGAPGEGAGAAIGDTSTMEDDMRKKTEARSKKQEEDRPMSLVFSGF